MDHIMGEMLPSIVGTIIDQHENISTFRVFDSSKNGMLPNTGEIQTFCAGFVLSFIIVGAGILIGEKYKKKKNIHIGLFLLMVYSFIFSGDVYASDKASSELNLQLINRIIKIKNKTYPKFDEVDLAKEGFSVHSTDDLLLTIENKDSEVTNIRLGYSWNVVSKDKNIGANTSVDIGKGQVTSDQPLTVNSFENKNIPENTVVDLVNITNTNNLLVEYRVPKDEITLNVDHTIDTGTYYICQQVYLIHDKENE